MPVITTSTSYVIRKEYVKCIEEITRLGEKGLLTVNSFTDIPNKYTIAWNEVNDRVRNAFHQFGVDASEVNTAQYKLVVWPTP